MVAFDLDGTLTTSLTLVELGREAGVADEMARLSERALAGSVEYERSLHRRVALLEGLAVRDAEWALDRLALRPGTLALLDALRDAGVVTAVVTSGFERAVAAVVGRDRFDHVVANRLVTADGALTGAIEGPLADAGKDEALSRLAGRAGVALDAVAAVGDGANDVPMFEAAGVAIGVEPTPYAREHCDVTVGNVAELREQLRRRGYLPE